MLISTLLDTKEDGEILMLPIGFMLSFDWTKRKKSILTGIIQIIQSIAQSFTL